MTMQRQYQLPNCSLVLDGLSIEPSPGNEDVMSLLVNAECRISGLERSLNGGYNFFAALVRAVSQYGQEVLSGYAHPQVIEGEPLLVHINPGDGPYHHLVVQPEIADLGESGDGRAIDIKLSSVQLFDLTEAVDQFFEDKQTLPELQPALSPLAKRFVRSEEPLGDRAVPAVLGVGTLVAAAMVFGLFPTPELRDPTAEVSQGDQVAEVIPATDTEGSSEPPTSDDAEIDASGDTEALAGDTEADDTEAASEEASEAPDETDVAEAPDGTDVAAIDQTDEATDELTESESTDSDPDFKSFEELQEDGETATVAGTGSTTFGSEPPAATSSFATVRSLNGGLKQDIVQNRDQPRFGEAVSYRVRVNGDGTVAGYEPINSSAESAIDETPLPKLAKDVASDEAAVDYRVVFTERGVVEVSPWWGWSYYE
ncbi:MAG: DUF4335 domain-containing protein [Cyanobacteria bacterium P01_D01_bin.36]